MLFWIWTISLVVAFGLYLRSFYTKFSRHGVKSSTPLPLFGNMLRVLLGKEHFGVNVEKAFYEFPGERFVGRYEFNAPLILLRDLELIKKITIKDFDHFLDHKVIIDKKSDSLFGRNLFSLKGDEWKDMRSTLSPAFTSSKIRVMVPFMVEVGEQMIKSLKKNIDASNDEYIEVDVKDLTSRYATDVIASCAFGLKVDSHADQENEFFLKGKVAATLNFKQLIIFLGFGSFPSVLNALKVSLFSEETKSFFSNLVTSTMKNREENHIIRPDMIHLLMQAKKGKLTHGNKEGEPDADAGFATVEESSVGKKEINREWTDDDMIAQAVIFFVAGFETVSSTMSFLLYELAVNPDVQDKLVREIKANEEKNRGKFDYNSVQQMKYLDMVVSELLRKWTPGVALDRMCTKDYNLGKPNDKATEDYIIRKGEGLQIPVWAFHRNPEYFPDPLKFDPERFSAENKHKIDPFLYMPFGIGPRNCIGSRFALCEVKVMVYQILNSMELSPSSKTLIPAQLEPGTFSLRLKGGFGLRFRIRK